METVAPAIGMAFRPAPEETVPFTITEGDEETVPSTITEGDEEVLSSPLQDARIKAEAVINNAEKTEIIEKVFLFT